MWRQVEPGGGRQRGRTHERRRSAVKGKRGRAAACSALRLQPDWKRDCRCRCHWRLQWLAASRPPGTCRPAPAHAPSPPCSLTLHHWLLSGAGDDLEGPVDHVRLRGGSQADGRVGRQTGVGEVAAAAAAVVRDWHCLNLLESSAGVPAAVGSHCTLTHTPSQPTLHPPPTHPATAPRRPPTTHPPSRRAPPGLRGR